MSVVERLLLGAAIVVCIGAGAVILAGVVIAEELTKWRD